MAHEKKEKKEKKEHKHEHVSGEDDSWSFDSKRFRGPKSNKDFPAALFHYVKSGLPKDVSPEVLTETAVDLSDERVMRYYDINFGGTEFAIPKEDVLSGWIAHLHKRAKKDKKKKRREKSDEAGAASPKSESDKSDKNGKGSPPREEESPPKEQLPVRSKSGSSLKKSSFVKQDVGPVRLAPAAVAIANGHISHMSAHSLDFELSESVVSQRRSTILDAADNELVETGSLSSRDSKESSLHRIASSNATSQNQSFKLQPIASGSAWGGSLGEKSPLSSAPPTPIFKENTSSAPPTPTTAPHKEMHAAKGVTGSGPGVRAPAGRGAAPPKPPTIIKETSAAIVIEHTVKKSQKEAKDVISLFSHQRILTSGCQALSFEDRTFRCHYDLQVLSNMSSIRVTFYSAGLFVYSASSVIDLSGKAIASLYWTFGRPSETLPDDVLRSLESYDFWTTEALASDHHMLHLLVGSKSDKVTVLFSKGYIGSYSCYISGKKCHTYEILTPKHVYQKR